MNMKTETMGSITGNVPSELSHERSSMRSAVFGALAVWFGLVFFLASQGAFVGSMGSPPLPIFLGTTCARPGFYGPILYHAAFHRSFPRVAISPPGRKS